MYTCSTVKRGRREGVYVICVRDEFRTSARMSECSHNAGRRNHIALGAAECFEGVVRWAGRPVFAENTVAPLLIARIRGYLEVEIPDEHLSQPRIRAPQRDRAEQILCLLRFADVACIGILRERLGCTCPAELGKPDLLTTLAVAFHDLMQL